MYKKLSSKEIKMVVDKIRKKYDGYCEQFFKSHNVRVAFDERYLNAIKNGSDLSTFLMAEISAIDELIKTEEEKLNECSAPNQSDKITQYIEGIMERNLKQIEKYKEIDFHADANPEIKKLLWALTKVDTEYFPSLFSIFRSLNFTDSLITLSGIEDQFRELTYWKGSDVPLKLSRYVLLLNRIVKEYSAFEREEKNYIKESAFALHDLAGLLIKTLNEHEDMDARDKDNLRQILNFITNIIIDFRLKDLKRNKHSHIR
ncbi:MAG: hypothetical protein JW969_13300 [Spirochaetales bacterium]|nr:hypothetical protein [Spirochaetales bacterium]